MISTSRASSCVLPNLTLTEMYNVLEDFRAGRPLDAAAQLIRDHGLVSVLRDLEVAAILDTLVALGQTKKNPNTCSV